MMRCEQVTNVLFFQTLVKTFEVCDLPVRASKFVARKNWVITGAVSFIQLCVVNATLTLITPAVLQTSGILSIQDSFISLFHYKILYKPEV